MKQVFLLFGFAAATSGLAVLGSTPAHALVTCTGSTMFGSLEGGSGANCGVLRLGEEVNIDVTKYFKDNASNIFFPFVPIAPAVGTNGTSLVEFKDVEFSVTGTVDVGAGPVAFTGPAAVWGPNPTGPFGSATTITYNATNPSTLPTGTFRTIDFKFNNLGEGIFGGEAASASEIGLALASVTNATIRATLIGGVNPTNPTVVSFGLGPKPFPTAIPAEGTTIGGFVTTEVPGPLPIAGAGAAFAWSRKLRRKLKLSASSRSTN
jgi:hypothetical protein